MSFGALFGGAMGGLGGAFGGMGGKDAVAGGSESFIDPDQAGYLKDKYGQAQDMFNQWKGMSAQEQLFSQMGMGQGKFMMGQGQDMMGMGMKGMQNFQGMQAPTMDFNQRNVNAAMDNPALQGMIDSSSKAAMDALGQTHAGMRGAEVGSGGVGGSRGQIERGIASGQTATGISQMASGLLTNQYNQATQNEWNRAGAQQQQDAAMQQAQGQYAQNMWNQGSGALQSGMGYFGQGAGMGRDTAFGAMDMYNRTLGNANILNKSWEGTPAEQGTFGKVMGGIMGGASSGMSI